MPRPSLKGNGTPSGGGPWKPMLGGGKKPGGPGGPLKKPGGGGGMFRGGPDGMPSGGNGPDGEKLGGNMLAMLGGMLGMLSMLGGKFGGKLGKFSMLGGMFGGMLGGRLGGMLGGMLCMLGMPDMFGIFGMARFWWLLRWFALRPGGGIIGCCGPCCC